MPASAYLKVLFRSAVFVRTFYLHWEDIGCLPCCLTLLRCFTVYFSLQTFRSGCGGTPGRLRGLQCYLVTDKRGV